MNLWKNTLFFIGVLVGCLSFSVTPVVHTPVAHGFKAMPAGTPVKLNLLMPLIFKPEWKIGYSYGVDCKPEDRQNDAELREAISKTLRAWLEPVKELQPARPIVDKFIYELQADFDPIQPDDMVGRDIEADLQGWRRVDLRVTFQCTHEGSSFAGIGDKFPPGVFMREGIKITPAMLFTLLHEIGHAFGLVDTYTNEFRPSSGGLRQTRGIQPASIMAMGLGYRDRKENHLPLIIGEDDKRGLIWLYKFFHENQAAKDCFFADYEFIEEEIICRPKHPLIFEVKHNPSKHTIQILKDDPNLNVNAQDVSGMTALHYAVMHEKVEVVEALLAHENINLALKNKQGHTPLDIAHETAITTRLVAMFPKNEPSKPSLDVAPAATLTTTWGAIKQR